MAGQARYAIRPLLDPPRSIQAGNFDLLFLSRDPQLVQGPSFDLPDPLLGDAHFGAHFLQGLRLVGLYAPQATNDNLLLALVKAFQNLADLSLALVLRAFLLVLVASTLFGAIEHVRMA